MLLTFFTLVSAATLGGGITSELTALVVLVAVGLAVIGVANGVRTVGRMFEPLRE